MAVSEDHVFTDVYDVAIDAPTHADEERVVLRWRRRGAVWEGLVSHEVDGQVVTDWVPALDMSPPEENT